MRNAIFGAVAIVIGLSASGRADHYESYAFTGQISPGNANVMPPFTSILSQGESISGTFLADTTLIPGAGSGFSNVNFSTYPDVAVIPGATLFQIKLGSLTIDETEAVPGSGAVQYNNGGFNGFAYTGDFMFQNNPYELVISGGAFSIDALVNGVPTFQNLVSGTINIGNSNLTDLGSFTPTAVPEPSSLILLGIAAMCATAYGRRISRTD